MNSIETGKMVIYNRNNMTKRYRRYIVLSAVSCFCIMIAAIPFYAYLGLNAPREDDEFIYLAVPLAMFCLLYTHMISEAIEGTFQLLFDRFEISAEGIRIFRLGRSRLFPWDSFHYIRESHPENSDRVLKRTREMLAEQVTQYPEIKLIRRYIPKGYFESQIAINIADMGNKVITLYLDPETELPELLRYCGGWRWESKPGRQSRSWDSERLMRRSRRGAVVVSVLLFLLIRKLYAAGLIASAAWVSFMSVMLFFHEILRGLLLIVDGIIGNERELTQIEYKKDVFITFCLAALKVRCKWILLQGEDGRKKRLFLFEPLCRGKLTPGDRLHIRYYPLSRVIKEITILPESDSP